MNRALFAVLLAMLVGAVRWNRSCPGIIPGRRWSRFC